jgi:thiamine kinase-like enzyme
MEDNQAKEQAVKMFQSFDIENEEILCTGANALQSLIPCVKRLLQLFPWEKEKTKHALSSDEVRNGVFLFETRRYIERINQSPLEFNSDASSFREFLESEQKINFASTDG